MWPAVSNGRWAARGHGLLHRRREPYVGGVNDLYKRKQGERHCDDLGSDRSPHVRDDYYWACRVLDNLAAHRAHDEPAQATAGALSEHYQVGIL